jgi:capsular polysaccharide transport system ATP-binding protein
MILLEGITKTYRARDSVKRILTDVTACFDDGRNVGILGVNGAGKSTLIRLLSGTELADSGRITRTSRVSFPLGFSAAIHPNVTGRENVVFMARVYGVDPRPVVDFVADFAELGNYFDMPAKLYSSGMMAKLSFGLSLAIDFDVYLIDEITAVGDARFQARCKEAFAQRVRHSNIVMVSHSFETIRAYCDAGAVLHDGNLIMYDTVETAIVDYKKLLGLAA